MRGNELEVLLDILPNYINHFKRYPGSLLAKIFGVFTVKKAGTGPVDVLLMENTLNFRDKKNLQYIFDLKGSYANRITNTGSRPSGEVRKDRDFLRIKKKRKNALNFNAPSEEIVQ